MGKRVNGNIHVGRRSARNPFFPRFGGFSCGSPQGHHGLVTFFSGVSFALKLLMLSLHVVTLPSGYYGNASEVGGEPPRGLTTRRIRLKFFQSVLRFTNSPDSDLADKCTKPMVFCCSVASPKPRPRSTGHRCTPTAKTRKSVCCFAPKFHQPMPGRGQ